MNEWEQLQAQLKEAVGKFQNAAAQIESQQATIITLQEHVERIERMAIQHAYQRDKMPFGSRPGLNSLDWWDTEKQAKDFVDFFKSVFQGDQEVIKQMSEGVDADGGYLVPTEFLPILIRIVENYGIVRQRATVVPMSRMEMEIPALASGVTVYWIGENNPITPTKPGFGQVLLTAKKLAALVPSSSELLEDSAIPIANLLVTLIGEAMAQEEDRVGFVGDSGGGDPFDGILNDSGVTAVTMTGSSFLNIDADDLADMIATLTAGQSMGAQFYFHRTVFNIIRKLKSTDGHYIYSPPNGQDPATIWGYPYTLTDVMPGVAADAPDTPFVIFGNLKHLYLGDRRRMTVATSQHVGFANDQVYLRVIQRLALDVAIPVAFAVLKTAAGASTTTTTT
jgi:HK97 family phage major capsid protein